jgi:c-di-GMP-binding flagellar brake protein YcgR
MELTRKENERRSKFRFAIQRDVRYKFAEGGVVVASGLGQTVDISSGGVAFVAERSLTCGGLVELSISWPMLLDQNCPMRFIVFGRVLRCAGGKAVCTIDRYEFRTQARTMAASASTRTDGMLQRWADGLRKESLRASAAGA